MLEIKVVKPRYISPGTRKTIKSSHEGFLVKTTGYVNDKEKEIILLYKRLKDTHAKAIWINNGRTMYSPRADIKFLNNQIYN